MSTKVTFGLGLALLVAGPTAQAYVGPGLGAGTIGVVLGILGAIFVALFGILYYPVKRRLKKRKQPEGSGDDSDTQRQKPQQEGGA